MTSKMIIKKQRRQEHESEKAIRDEMVAYLDNLLVQQCNKKIAASPSTVEQKASNNLRQRQDCALAAKMTTTARLLEHLLFQDASSLEMYCEMTTLKDRLKGISVKLLRRKLQKRQNMIFGESIAAV